MREIGNSVSGGGAVEGEGLRSVSKQMSLKSRLLEKKSREEQSRGRLQIREISESGELEQAETVGAALRSARLRRGADITTVATQLKIKREHIEAIEDDDKSRLPARAYALGFVRTYAEYLGLDANECVRRFKSDMSTVAAPTTGGISFPEVREEVRLPQGSMLILAILLAAGIYGGWYLSVSADKMVIEGVPAVPERLANAEEKITPVSEVAVPATPSSVGGPNLQVQTPSEGGAPVAQAVTNGETVALGSSDDMQLTSLVPADAESLAVGPSEGGRAFGEVFGNSRIVLRARNQAWLRVEDANSEVLIQQEMMTHDRYYAPEAAGLILSVRDAGAFDLILDGQLMGTLGKPGQVLPSVSLDPDMIGLLGGNRTN